MANEYPLVTVIIPVHPAKTEARSAAASKLLDYPREKLEIIVVRSTDLATYPSMKRNAARRSRRATRPGQSEIATSNMAFATSTAMRVPST